MPPRSLNTWDQPRDCSQPHRSNRVLSNTHRSKRRKFNQDISSSLRGQRPKQSSRTWRLLRRLRLLAMTENPMLTSLSHVLTPAHRDGYAIPAFNIKNLETLLAVVEAARAEQSPVIIQTSEGAVDYAGMDALGGMVHGVARDPH